MTPTPFVRPHDLDRITLPGGQTLLQHSNENPVMLVFLRHLGCVFCKEALEDISNSRAELNARAVKIVFVHMEDETMGKSFLAKYGLEDCVHISDPECELYKLFGLAKGKLSQLLGFQSLVKGFTKGVAFSQMGGGALGDAFQMPGIFMIRKGKIEAEFIHDKAWDRPNYVDLADTCLIS